MSLSSGRKPKATAPIKLNLALQGGGAHGAFTWGVLDRLLDEHDIEIAGITGASAGAMNAAVLASGYAEDEDVRATLALGAGAFVGKPYTLEKIGAAIYKVLQS